jgi:2-polyprenyl-6-methoxyphenol hydroxylase-like FAD-dependent oxidoreductase
MSTFTILGGGIAGLTTAIALRRIGITATVFEAAPELHPVGAGLGMGGNAIHAFEALGLRDALIARGRLLHAFSIRDARGRVISRTASSRGKGPDHFTIHRAELHAFLLSQLGADTPILGKRAERITRHEDRITVHFADGTEHAADQVIVADGIGSRIRRSLVPWSAPRYAGYTCWRGVVHAADMPLDEATETWGAQGRFGIVPLSNDRIYWFATIAGAPRDPRLRAFRVADLRDHFAGYHDLVCRVLSRATDESLIHGDIHDLDPIPHYAHGRVLLIGDAAHATTPNLGQGACQAIEDAVVLAHALREHADAEQAFKAFEQARVARTHWITRTSRRIGDVAEWRHPLLITLRNGLFRMMPPAVNERQMQKVVNVQFEPLPGSLQQASVPVAPQPSRTFA